MAVSFTPASPLPSCTQETTPSGTAEERHVGFRIERMVVWWGRESSRVREIEFAVVFAAERIQPGQDIRAIRLKAVLERALGEMGQSELEWASRRSHSVGRTHSQSPTVFASNGNAGGHSPRVVQYYGFHNL